MIYKLQAMRKKIAVIFLVVCGAFVFPCWGKVPDIKQHDLSSEIKKVRIQVHHAHLRLISVKKNKDKLKTRYPSDLKIKKEGSTLVVSEKSFPHKEKAWQTVQKKPSMTVWLPNIPLEVALFSGKVEANRQTNLSVFMLNKGEINIKNTKGKLNVFQKSGSINIHSHKGNIRIQTEDSRVNLSACKGKKMNWSGFKGRFTVQKSSGHLSTWSFKAPLVLKHFTGRLDFQQEKGGVYLQPMIGSVFGKSQAGEIKGAIHAGEVNMETQSGGINLDFPHSKAWVKAETWEGKISAPVYFNRIKTGGMDRSKGKLRGKKRTGNISLKSQSGSIRIYQSAL